MSNVCKQGENVLNVRRFIVVFVPGVMGSRLTFSAGTWSVDHHWDPNHWWRMVFWAGCPAGAMRDIMRVDGSYKASIITDNIWMSSDCIDRGHGSVADAFYGDFLKQLDSQAKSFADAGVQLKVFAYGYDWRQPIRDLGKSMVDDIMGGPSGNGLFGSTGLLEKINADPDDQLIFITHSMGGLVTRAALKQSPEMCARTAAVFHGFQPATGATTFYRRCLTGATPSWDGGGGVEGAILSCIIGSDGPAFSTVVSGMPGPVNLFPSPRLSADISPRNKVGLLSWKLFDDALAASPIPATKSIYDYARQNELAVPPGILRSDIPEDVRTSLSQRLDQTSDFHTFISENGQPDGAPWYLKNKTWAVYGTGIESDNSMQFNCLPPKIQTEIIPTGDAPVILYYVVRRDGTKQYISQEMIDQSGYFPNPKFDPPITRLGRSAFGDETVPDASGAALFGLPTDCDPADTSPPLPSDSIEQKAIDFNKMRQFSVSRVHHGDAFKSDRVRNFAIAWLKHVTKPPAPSSAP